MERWAAEALQEFINEKDLALQQRLERANHERLIKANTLGSYQYIVRLIFRFLHWVTDRFH